MTFNNNGQWMTKAISLKQRFISPYRKINILKGYLLTMKIIFIRISAVFIPQLRYALLQMSG